jgi:hypothetical protein
VLCIARVAASLGASAFLACPAAARADFPEAPRPGRVREPADRVFFVAAQGEVSVATGETVRQVYGPRHPFGAQLRGTWLFQERVGGGLGLGFQVRGGTGVAASGDPPETRLLVIPLLLEGVLRLALWRDQPAVPYLRAGFDAVFWSERDGAGNPRGMRWGVHGALGCQIRLPFPEIQWEGRLGGDPLLDDIYLHVEGWGRSTRPFGRPGLDLSAFGLGLGITLVL